MSQAIISGSAGVAVLTHDGALFSIDIDRLDELVPCQSRDVAYLFGDARDQQIVERVDPATVKRMLDQAWRGAEGLQLALILLDGEMDDETRTLAAGELNEALAARDTLDHVEGVLSSRPLPASASLAGALALAVAAKMDGTQALLLRLRARQAVIGEVWEAFEAVPTRLFGDEGDRGRARAALVREGVFRELVLAREGRKNLGGAAVRAVRNHWEIGQTWIRALVEGRVLQQPPEAPTAGQYDGVAYHLRGILLPRDGSLRVAEDTFAYGVQHEPLAADRDHFRITLAVIHLGRCELGSALALLAEVKLPALQAPANVLYTHALALQGDTARAAEAFARIPAQGTPLLLDIREELRRRLGHEPPRYAEEALIDLEIDLIDQAA